MGTSYWFCCLTIWTLAIVKSVRAQEYSPCILTALTTNFAERGGPTEIVGDTFKLVHINSDSEYATLVSTISSVFPRHRYHSARPFKDSVNVTRCSKIIGVVGDLDSKTASIIHTLASRSNLSITLVAAVAPSTFLPVTNLVLPSLLDMTPLSHYVEALVSFLDHLNWTRIGLITDNTYYYQFAAELLQKRFLQNSQNIVIPSVRTTDDKMLQIFQEYETRIIVVLTDASSACSILQEAGKLQFKWPDYSLIVIDLEKSKCSMMDGVILLNERINLSNTESGCNSSCTISSPVVRNLTTYHRYYSNILHDSVLAVVLAGSLNFSNASFPGVTGPVKIRENKRLWNISFMQIINSSRLEIAYYNSQSQQFVMLPNTYLTTGTIPRGNTLVVMYRPSVLHVTLVVTAYIFCNIFVSVVFVLYIYFRKEPEIKATSVTVSLCMFLGCYLILLFVPVLLVEAHPLSYLPHLAEFSCNLLAWLSLLGLPLTLILATLFVKMLRVYLIFFAPNSFKRKLFSNPLLFLYIVLLTSPSILILLLWTGSDTLINTPYNVVEKSHVVQFEKCLSNTILVWLGLQMIYISVLIIVLAIFAFKSSEIRYKNFRDTKETNAFAFITIYITLLTLLYFYFFYGSEARISNTIAEKFTLYIGHMIIPMACQVFLFVPKVYPPIKRHFKQNIVKMKTFA